MASLCVLLISCSQLQAFTGAGFRQRSGLTTTNTTGHLTVKMGTFAKVLLASICVAFLAVKWNAPTLDAESLRGARVLVTGASTGIGEQIAYHYARFGARVVITARREKVLQQVAEKCTSLGAQEALYIAADMGSEQDPEKVVEFALEKLGGLDYLVLNHIGVSHFKMWDGDVEYFEWLMKVNLFSYVQMASKAMDSLEQSKGSLVIISSLLGKVASPFMAPYSSTKAALNGFFRSLYHELSLKKSNVSITLCTLGFIDTDAAMEKVGKLTDVPAASATDAALNIVTAGALRKEELFYPWKTYIVTLTKDWFPPITNHIMQNIFKYEP
ncbi:hydroxysteroid 11-beta-dehydrogenase 1-like protein [Hippoglossus stenolepis]|uniref:hydroxysteroid 11-beta-dehydrogenase 1-like protein n=1 Tax=Hippoglossus stenolepis TaxID=195615 RepID=UPI001FAE759A|nr:hydroxysteroid 11-beta-dehydrogenase 1-like protein [Hippoglossus stenolepis]